jgi:hypothetical protein
MQIKSIVIALACGAATLAACGGKKQLGDKGAACDNIYKSYLSRQDKKVWTDACMAAPDEVVRCMNLVSKEGDDSDCMKNIRNPERSKLVPILNGKPDSQ